MNQIYDDNKLGNAESNEQFDENLINKFNIINLFGKETLENVQDKISKATGLAFVTVDYKGEPITKMTSFTEFCRKIRDEKDGACACKASDAFGGIQAAVTQKNCVYFCPCGLLEIAIPIIVRGHYLGGFIGGQVRCTDAPAGTSRLESVIKHSKNYKNDKKMIELFESTLIYEYEKFVSVSELISLIINQLGEKEAFRVMQKSSLKKEVEKLNNNINQLEVENKLKKIEFNNLKAKLNPYFIINILSSISNLATIEDSPKTNEMIIMFAEYLKQSLSVEKEFLTIEEEFENINKYLKIQQIKYGKLLKYCINISQEISMQKVPANIIMSFVERAVFYGIAAKNKEGEIKVNDYYNEDDVVISIDDNGPGYTDEDISRKYRIFKGGYEGDAIQTSIANSRQKLVTLFGEKYDVIMECKKNKGTVSLIKYPRSFSERDV